MTDRFDAIRAANPDLAISLYALTPGGSVTLEVLDATGGSWTWVGATGADAMEMAFPSEPELLMGEDLPPVPLNEPAVPVKLRRAKSEPVTVSSPAPSIFD